jgi:hypothetical protein
MIFQSGLIVMGNLPRVKLQRFFEVVKNMKIFQSGFIIMGDLLQVEKYDLLDERIWLEMS